MFDFSDGGFLFGNTSLILPFAVIIIGSLVALVAIPNFRKSASDQSQKVKTFLGGEEPPSNSASELEVKENENPDSPTAPPARRELDEFDLSIFADDE